MNSTKTYEELTEEEQKLVDAAEKIKEYCEGNGVGCQDCIFSLDDSKECMISERIPMYWKV